MKTLLVVLCFSLVGCTKSGGAASGGSATSAATATVVSNSTIGSWPHQIDFYAASNATRAVIFLHGGGGQKHSVANQLGIKTTSSAADYSSFNSSFLIQNQVVMVFPQGQTISGNSYTWTNYVMDSGQNDVSFLNDLADAIRARYPAVTKIYLAGHSNGGMMASRMWCESNSKFTAFATFAGPPATDLGSSGAHPCSPSTAKPMFSIVGTADSVLQTSGNWNASTWTINSIYVTAAFTNTNLLTEKIAFANTRVPLRCAETPSSGSVSGSLTTFTNCNGSIKLIRVTGADHCLSPSGICTSDLASTSGLDLKTAMLQFFASY